MSVSRSTTRAASVFLRTAGGAESSIACTCMRQGKRWSSTTAEADQAETAAAAPVSYPFSSSVSHPDVSTSDVPAGPFSLMDKVNKSLLLSSTSSFRSLFHRRSADRIPPGSIISVETYNQLPAPGSDEAALANVGAAAFAGVLMKVKRRHAGVDDAFTVRANVGKPSTGTEVRFDVNSPWIKNVKVLKRDDDKRRAKLYYIRRDDKFLAGVQGAIRMQQQQTQVATAGKKGPPQKGGSKKAKKQK